MSDQVTVTENNTLVTVTTDNIVNVTTAQDTQTIVLPTTTSIPTALGEIRDVDLDVAPTDGQVLAFDETSSTWQPESLATVDLSPLLKIDQTTPQQGVGAFDINVKRSKMLTVDAGGRGDYTTIKAACDFVATQTPGSANQWVIQVLSGYYTEAPFTIPTYCLIQGLGQTPTGNSAHCVRITPTAPWLGGTFITVNSLGAIDNCGIIATLDATATSNGIIASGNGRYTRCWFQGTNSTNGTYNLKDMSGGVILQDCNVYVGGSNSTAIYFSAGGAVKQCWIYTAASGTNIIAINADGYNDDINISFVRFGANSGNFFNYDIKVDAGRVHVLHSNYRTYTGDVREIGSAKNTLSGTLSAIAATDVVSTLKGAATQTANLLELKDSADAILMSISAAGKISGAAASGGNLTLESSAHATKGKILFGNSAYDEVNNRLGIGTNAPTAKLQVVTPAGLISAFTITDATYYTLTAGYQATGLAYFGGPTGTSVALKSNGVEVMRLAAGYVGINQTNPVGNLDIKTIAVNDVGIKIRGMTGQTGNLLELLNLSTILSAFDATGKLALGGATPRALLHVISSAGEGTPTIASTNIALFQRNATDASNVEISLIAGSATGVASINFGDKDSATAGKISFNNTSNAFYFYTNNSGTPGLFISNANHVGINTLSPLQKLDVNGNATADRMILKLNPSGATDAVSKEWAESRTQNLITNGSGLMGDNYNFSGFTFDAVETHGGGGSFAYYGAGSTKFNDDLIPVDVQKYYRMILWGKSGNVDGTEYDATNKQYAGIAPIDADGNVVVPNFSLKHPGSVETTLAVALNPGDTTITLTDATGWNNGATGVRGIVWWPYTNLKGFTYPTYTYTRNTSSATLWAAGAITGNVITLTVPWAGVALPVNTPVRNFHATGTYKYIALGGPAVPNTWTRYEGYIGSEQPAYPESNTQFPFGTQYIKLLFLTNYTGPAGFNNRIRWSDIVFTEMSSWNLEGAIANKPGIVTTGAQVMGAGNKYFPAKISVGQITAVSMLDVKADSTGVTGIISRGIAAQTGNLFEARNSSDAILAYIDAAGIVKAAGYKSSDASAGLTQTVTVRNAAGDGTTVLTFKNGLLTGVA